MKCISSCPSRYARNPRATVKAVDKRASTLPREYQNHAKSIHQVYGEVPRGVAGPEEARLLSFPPLRGWVFGAWGEASEDIHSLVHDLASARQKHQHLLDGRRGGWSRLSEEGELALLTGQIRRSLSLEAVRNQARCLLGRLSGLGAGAAAAAKRRAWAGAEERRMERERRAYNLSLSQGRCPLRRGQFLLT